MVALNIFISTYVVLLAATVAFIIVLGCRKLIRYVRSKKTKPQESVQPASGGAKIKRSPVRKKTKKAGTKRK